MAVVKQNENGKFPWHGKNGKKWWQWQISLAKPRQIFA